VPDADDAATKGRLADRLEAFYSRHPPAKPKTRAQVEKLVNTQPWGVVCGKLRAKYGTDPDAVAAQGPEHQRDFVPAFSPAVEAAVRAAVGGPAGAIPAAALDRGAELCELTAVTSEPGAAEQALHADACRSAAAPRLVTLFLALHGVLDEGMGPTRFCLETHAPRCFPGGAWLPPPDVFSRPNPRAAERLAERPPVWFGLNAGDAVLMDSTTWHCGGVTRLSGGGLFSVFRSSSRAKMAVGASCESAIFDLHGLVEGSDTCPGASLRGPLKTPESVGGAAAGRATARVERRARVPCSDCARRARRRGSRVRCRMRMVNW
jgi:hypothetical protein